MVDEVAQACKLCSPLRGVGQAELGLQCPTCRADVTLQPGAPVDGITMTPIAPVAEGTEEDDAPSGIRAAVGNAVQQARALLSRPFRFARGANDEADERAPLVTPRQGR